jgi:PTS system nitrogen regulatory IIA component
LITPTVRVHLYLLSRLASLLLDPGFKAVLNRQAPREEILAAVRTFKKETKP